MVTPCCMSFEFPRHEDLSVRSLVYCFNRDPRFLASMPILACLLLHSRLALVTASVPRLLVQNVQAFLKQDTSQAVRTLYPAVYAILRLQICKEGKIVLHQFII